MNIIFLGFLVLAAALPYDVIQKMQQGGGRRLYRKKLNLTSVEKLGNDLHMDMRSRGSWIKKIQQKKHKNSTDIQKAEIEEKLAQIPENNLEKPEGLETVNLFERNYLEGVSDFMIEGDMHLSDEQLKTLEDDIDNDNDDYKNSTRRKRQVTTIYSKWTGNTVYYYFDTAISQRIRNSVSAALGYIQANTCVSFIQSATAQNRIKVYPGNGCFSSVGMLGNEQQLSLGTGCESMGTAAHEFSHALGGWHTQMRYDRDNYITVNTAAVSPDKVAANFNKIPQSQSVLFVPYEYGSVMHYPPNAFASSSGAISMIAKDATFQSTMGGNIFTFYDLKNINDNYCTGRCPTATSAKCQNGGVPNPRNCAACVCPAGYGGNLCDQRPAGCGETLTATTAWQTTTYTVGDNTDQNVRDVFTICNHWITAPAGKRITIKVTSISNSQCQFGCPFTSLEIKLTDQQLTNPRICCSTDMNKEFTSNFNPTPFISHNRYRTSTFTVQYKISDSTVPPVAPAPAPAPSSCSDNANCPNWVANGFCTSSGFTQEVKAQYCPSACGLCGSSGSSSISCTDANANCASFVNSGFCTNNFYSTDVRKANCAKSCGLC